MSNIFEKNSKALIPSVVYLLACAAENCGDDRGSWLLLVAEDSPYAKEIETTAALVGITTISRVPGVPAFVLSRPKPGLGLFDLLAAIPDMIMRKTQRSRLNLTAHGFHLAIVSDCLRFSGFEIP